MHQANGMKCPSSFQFQTDVCRRAEHFHDCSIVKEIFLSLQKFSVFLNSGVRTDHGLLLPFGLSVMPVELIFFSSQSTLVVAQFFPENFSSPDVKH